ncbi:MAG: GNAT family N-acetyltransferase [Pirellulales bacterium]|nr:GNAT family N-acetyltransferase [Pirellulales bacterium]
MITVQPVHTRQEQRQFVDFPWRHYAGDSLWIPPLLVSIREALNYTPNPFYDQAAIQTFLAREGNRVVGRIAAIENRAHNQRYHEERAFFGFYEAGEDPAITAALLSAVRDWSRARGLRTLRGPVNPSLNYELGLLVDGFHKPPAFMMSYNKPYYAARLESCGLAKSQDLYAFYGHVNMLGTLDKKLQSMVDAAKERFGVKLRALDKRRFLDEVRMFLDIYNRSLVNTWGFVPLSEGEVRHLAAGLKHLIVPELSIIAEIEGQPVGCCFALLDYNPRIKQINGRLFPFGFLRLLWNRRAIKQMRVISANVIPEYQRWGLGLVLLNGLVPKVMEWGIQEAEFSWVLESNHLSRASLEKGGAKLDKTYRLYDGLVDAD